MAPPKKKQKKLVTKESLQKMLSNNNPRYVEKVVGKAIVGLYKRQTAGEQNSECTKEHNGVGFASYDAVVGTKVAKTWLEGERLAPWMIEVWLKPNKKGFSRLSKYHRQLNEIALEKAKCSN